MKKPMVLTRTSVKLFAVIAAMLGLSLWAGTGAFAQDRPCAGDVAKFCKDAQQSKGGVAKCLKEHADELSPSCKETVAAAKQKAQDFSAACKSDMQKFCKQARRGGGRIVQCLKEHESELSPDCKTAMSQAKKGA